MTAASAQQRQQQRAQVVAASVVQRAAEDGVALPDDLRLWSLTGNGAVTRSDIVRVRARDSDDRAVEAGGAPGTVVGDGQGVELAAVLESATSAGERRARGLHVTPAWLADQLVARALDGLDVPPADITVCDPACGGGAFLLAAARALHARGIARADVVRHHLWGADVDPVGLATAEAALALWAGEAPPSPRLALGDALLRGRRVWQGLPPPPFAAVVGNPPFLNQLGRATVRSARTGDRLRRRYGTAVQPYTDTAWLFLLLGAELARRGGRVVMIQPVSVVGARDAAAVRTTLDKRTELRDLWVEDRPTFAAAVQVCAPVLAVRDAALVESRASRWADRLADAKGVPRVDVPSGQDRLGDLAEATAGFRDEYYGLVPLVREDGDGDEAGLRRLVTVGVLQWGRSAWGERTTTFAKRRWQRPVVDVARLDPTDASAAARGGARWIERVSRPKLVVATQTRVVEAAVDEAGTWVPSVPAIAVLPHAAGDLWRLAAAVSSPTATAWLLRRAPGTALSRNAMKIAARDLAELPLPPNSAQWDAAAAALRDFVTGGDGAAFDCYVVAAAAAYSAPPGLVEWWRQRL